MKNNTILKIECSRDYAKNFKSSESYTLDYFNKIYTGFRPYYRRDIEYGVRIFFKQENEASSIKR